MKRHKNQGKSSMNPSQMHHFFFI